MNNTLHKIEADLKKEFEKYYGNTMTEEQINDLSEALVKILEKGCVFPE